MSALVDIEVWFCSCLVALYAFQILNEMILMGFSHLLYQKETRYTNFVFAYANRPFIELGL